MVWQEEMQTAIESQATNPAIDVSAEKKKKKYKFKPGTVSLREIKKLQKTTKHLIQKKPFYRLVKEICAGVQSNCKFQQEAMSALQEDAENYLVEFFKKSQKNAIHAGRKTVHIQDFKTSD